MPYQSHERARKRKKLSMHKLGPQRRTVNPQKQCMAIEKTQRGVMPDAGSHPDNVRLFVVAHREMTMAAENCTVGAWKSLLGENGAQRNGGDGANPLCDNLSGKTAKK